MIRVLQVVTYMGRGGLETMLMNYYRCLNRDKVQFDFLVHRDFEADYDQEILSMGGKIFHASRLVPWSRGYREELKRFFRAHPEYKIVHVHQDCLSSVALECAKECGVLVRIAHSHNSNQDKNIKYIIKRHYMKKIPQFATDLFACGKNAGEWMFAGHQYKILHNAINASDYTYSSKKAITIRKRLQVEQNLVIGHVGRFDTQKNHTFLLDIFSECVKFVPNARLLLVGDGEGKTQIQEKARFLGLENKVIFIGVRNDVADLLQAMDVFVFPSLYEGVPVTMIEAQASGLPCIISDGVPGECIITSGLVTSMKLSDTPCDWAKYIVAQSHRKRENHLKEIQAAGYDIVTAAKELEDFYLKKCGE